MSSKEIIQKAVNEALDEHAKDLTQKLSSPHAMLSRLYRKVLMKDNMTIERFDELMSIYVAQPGMTRKQETDSRGKLRKTLAAQRMTLLNLIQGLRVLRATRFTFTLSVEFHDRPPVTVSETVRFAEHDGQTKH